jgi:hypothetical protein
MNMRKPLFLGAVTILAGVSSAAGAAGLNIHLKPWVYDPAKTDLVSSKLVDGLGCPLNTPVAMYPSTTPTGAYTDPTCTTGDFNDSHNRGLLLAKTGPLLNNASGGASIDGLKHEDVVLTELGYDIRNVVSHCGAGAPRFDIVTTTGQSYFLGCSSPPPTTSTTAAGSDWTRKRWGNGSAGSVMGFNYTTNVLEPIADPIKSIDIVFDEGTDAASAPDPKGIAILDNIDVNGVMAGD